MEKRRKNQNSLDQDLEFAADGLPEEGVKKDSRFFYYSAFAGFLVIVGLVFFSSSASIPIRQLGGIKSNPLDVDTKIDRVTVADIGAVANTVSADSKGVNKISDMISLNKKCLVRY